MLIKVNPEFVFYGLGVDSAPAQGQRSDDGALVVLRWRPKVFIDGKPKWGDQPHDWIVDPVFARKLRGASTRQWSGVIHELHQSFGFARIMLDHGGGGQWVKSELNKSRQLIRGIEQECRPIATPDDVAVAGAAADLILSLATRGDVYLKHLWPDLRNDSCLVDNLHTALRQAFEYRDLALPVPFNERPAESQIGRAHV